MHKLDGIVQEFLGLNVFFKDLKEEGSHSGIGFSDDFIVNQLLTEMEGPRIAIQRGIHRVHLERYF